MARRKKGRPVSGWLILDKPSGLTSTHAVGRIKRLFQAQKAGHAGTLDPLATGILPLALGEATKTVSFAMDGEKSYRFTVRWGEETDTDDSEGKITTRADARPSQEAIERLVPDFIGEVMQVPPRFSAIKVEGERAYDLARSGEEVELKARPVQIDDLRLVASPDPDQAIFEADCGKGTYVRALARDMGRELGCYGHITALRRTRVGPFSEDDAVSLDELEAAAEDAQGPEELDRFLSPVESALDDIPALPVSSADAASLARGQAIIMRGRDAPILSGTAYTTCRGILIALVEAEKGELRPFRVFQQPG